MPYRKFKGPDFYSLVVDYNDTSVTIDIGKGYGRIKKLACEDYVGQRVHVDIYGDDLKSLDIREHTKYGSSQIPILNSYEKLF